MYDSGTTCGAPCQVARAICGQHIAGCATVNVDVAYIAQAYIAGTSKIYCAAGVDRKIGTSNVAGYVHVAGAGNYMYDVTAIFVEQVTICVVDR